MGGISMIKTPKCLFYYLQQTKRGDRNNNLFKAVKHVKYVNEFKVSSKDLFQTAKKLNSFLKVPLSEREVAALTKSVSRHKYGSSCKTFHGCCYPSNQCKSRPFNCCDIFHRQILDSRNHVKMAKPVDAYPWDFEDLDNLTSEQRTVLMEFRAEKGVNPMIDKVLKLRKVECGSKALEKWNKWRGVEVNGS